MPLNGSRSSQCHHLSKFRWAGVPGATYQVSRILEKKILKGFYRNVHGGHLGHVTKISRTKVSATITKTCPCNIQRFLKLLEMKIFISIFFYFFCFVEIGPPVLEKILRVLPYMGVAAILVM